jgi:cysteinyl-tRNA synthetase
MTEGYPPAAELTRVLSLPRVELFDSVPSTLDVAHERAAGGAPGGTLILADAQTGGVPDGDAGPDAGTWRESFGAAMDDDFNTPKALAVLQGLAREINEAKAGSGSTCLVEAAGLAATFRELAATLGICQLDPEQWFRLPSPGSAAAGSMTDAEIEGVLAERQLARRQTDFKRADALREQLAQAGVIFEDKPDGTSTWRRR